VPDDLLRRSTSGLRVRRAVACKRARFFTNDELSYILSARMGAAGYLIPAFRATPGTGSLGVLLQGSYSG